MCVGVCTHVGVCDYGKYFQSTNQNYLCTLKYSENNVQFLNNEYIYQEISIN